MAKIVYAPWADESDSSVKTLQDGYDSVQEAQVDMKQAVQAAGFEKFAEPGEQPVWSATDPKSKIRYRFWAVLTG